MSIDIDPVATAGLVTREVRSGERDGTPTKIAVARRSYTAARGDVWAAVTDPERIPRWFMPISGDLAEGGRYQLEGNAGGTVERCQAPEAFAVTWEFGGGVSWVTVTLHPFDGGTMLQLVHESPVEPEFWEQFGPGAVGVGWDGALLGLSLHLAGGELPAVEDLDQDPAVREFNAASARAWGEAQLAAGTDPALVEANVAATTAFYVPPQDD
jgi:uncharacterized protein YndB with AHSA1/START domain